MHKIRMSPLGVRASQFKNPVLGIAASIVVLTCATSCSTTSESRDVDFLASTSLRGTATQTGTLTDGKQSVARTSDSERLSELVNKGTEGKSDSVGDEPERWSARGRSTPEHFNQPAIAVAPSRPGAYRIQPHDVIRISVYGEAAISMDYAVSAAGEINHPFLGRVKLEGMSVEQAQEYITKRLDRDFLVNPMVTVTTVKSAGRRIIIFGQVKSPGEHHIPHDQPMTLLRAIATAGGFTGLAAQSRIRIVRKTADDEGERVINADVTRILRGRGDAQDIPLQPDDVITVPESIF